GIAQQPAWHGVPAEQLLTHNLAVQFDDDAGQSAGNVAQPHWPPPVTASHLKPFWLPAQLKQALPVLPHTASAVPGWQVVALRQPPPVRSSLLPPSPPPLEVSMVSASASQPMASVCTPVDAEPSVMPLPMAVTLRSTLWPAGYDAKPTSMVPCVVPAASVTFCVPAAVPSMSTAPA